MKYVTTVLLFGYMISIAGCSYDVPLTDNQRLPLDARLVGTWKATINTSMGEVTIGKISATEYSFRFTEAIFGGSYMRGYPINVDGVSLVQLRLTDEHFTPQTGSGKYFVVSLTPQAGSLVIKYLELGGSSGEMKSSTDLKRLFVQEKHDGALAFVELDKFAKRPPTVLAATANGRRRMAGRSSAKITPKQNPPLVAEDKQPTISISPKISEPTEEEMKEALIRTLKLGGGERKPGDTVVRDNSIGGMDIKIERFEKLGCKPADQGEGFICTYNVTNSISLHNNDGTNEGDKQAAAWNRLFAMILGANQAVTERVTARFVHTEQGWITWKD